MEHDGASAPISVYREFAPSDALGEYVRALAWFGPASASISGRPVRELYVGHETALTPSFADAHACLLFPLGVSYAADGWHASAAAGATLMGALSRATDPPAGARPAMIAAYLRPRGIAALLGGPAKEITDRVIALDDVWPRIALAPERTNLQMVEAFLVRRLSAQRTPERALRVAEVATHMGRVGGRVGVTEMAELTGLSRQHLRRLFLEYLGVSPKLYARLARFRAGLRHLRNTDSAGGWSRLAARLGYADQSHLIAEFREFTSFTPAQLARGEIGRAHV